MLESYIPAILKDCKLEKSNLRALLAIRFLTFKMLNMLTVTKYSLSNYINKWKLTLSLEDSYYLIFIN